MHKGLIQLEDLSWTTGQGVVDEVMKGLRKFIKNHKKMMGISWLVTFSSIDVSYVRSDI